MAQLFASRIREVRTSRMRMLSLRASMTDRHSLCASAAIDLGVWATNRFTDCRMAIAPKKSPAATALAFDRLSPSKRSIGTALAAEQLAIRYNQPLAAPPAPECHTLNHARQETIVRQSASAFRNLGATGSSAATAQHSMRCTSGEVARLLA